MPSYELAALKRKILRERGFDCTHFKEPFLLRRVEIRMRFVGQPTISAYSRYLDQVPEEYARLFDALSINVTQFFRDASTFHVIRANLLPTLLADKAAAGSRTFRAWSAGCATGQETYSLAILLAEALERGPTGVITRVYGTDIDARALAYARQGLYEPAAMEGVADAYALRHFVPNGHHYRVSPEICQLVRYKVHDLTEDLPLRHVDLLLCRNVLIYFSKEAQRRLLDTFYTALRPGGFLVLGRTETMGAEMKRRFVAFDTKERVYRKSLSTSFVLGGR